MATQRAIKNKIGSVEQIRKITSALEVVALTRLRRMETDAIEARGYFDKIREMLSDVITNINFRSHPFLKKRKAKNSIAIISIFSNKGLCGNFNANVGNKLREFTAGHSGKIIETIIIGKKGTRHIRQQETHRILSTHALDKKETIDEDILKISHLLIDRFLKGDVDEIFLIYSKFKLHLLGEVKTIRLLPARIEGNKVDRLKKHQRDYIYSPGIEEVFNRLVRDYITNQIHQGVLESRCAEEMSRMLAMKTATDNANDTIGDLRLLYNKSRQAQITKELTEVIMAADIAI